MSIVNNLSKLSDTEQWYTELGPMWKGQGLSLQIEKILHEEKSQFQHIVVFDSVAKGRVLVLDGAIQTTDHDEFSYQEMITHLPIFGHRDPSSVRKVCIIGGGDGGVVRECLKHSQIEEIHLCEIDERVIEVAKQFLPNMSSGYSDPRVKVHIYDGAKFLRENPNTFDIIITDSSDPVGPAESLYSKDFYSDVERALNEGGVFCNQAESLWIHLDSIKEWFELLKTIFHGGVEYAYTTIPTYPSGMIGFFLACKTKGDSCKKPHSTHKEEDKVFKYYNSRVHEAAFVLPQFAAKALNQS